MICKTCGSVIPDDAVKCDICGVKVYRERSGVAATRLKMLGVGAGIGLVIVGALAIPAFIGGTASASSQQGAPVASDLVTQKELVVPVQASGLDESGSRIAVHVKGLTSGGTSVDQNGYVNHEGKGLTLEQGTYEVTAVGSPISSSGAIYNLPATSVTVDVSAEGGSSYTTGAMLALTPIDAASVTDEQIEAARQWAANDPERAASADHLVEAVRQRRDAAQKAAAGANAGAKKEEAEQHNENQSEQSSGTSSDSSDQSSDSSSQSQSNDSYYPYYGSDYDSSQQYYAGNNAEPTQDSGASAGTSGGDAQQPDSSQDSGQGGQQVDPAPPDASSGGGSDSGGSQGSGADQGGSSTQPATEGSNAGGGTSTSGGNTTA